MGTQNAPDDDHGGPRVSPKVRARLAPDELVIGVFDGDWRPLAVGLGIVIALGWGIGRNDGWSFAWLVALTAIAPLAVWSQPLRAVVTQRRVLLVRAWPWEITSEPTAAIVAVRKGPRWWLGGGVVIECSMKRATSVPRQLRYYFPRDPEAYRRALLGSVEAARQRTAP